MKVKQVLDNQSACLNSKIWKLHAQLDDDDWMIAAEKFKSELESDVNSRLKSDPVIVIDFSQEIQH